MEYEPVFGLENIAKRFNEASHDASNHFVEGLQYSLDEAVLMTAVMVPDHEVDHKKVKSICLKLLNMSWSCSKFPLNRSTMLANGISHGSSNMLRKS